MQLQRKDWQGRIFSGRSQSSESHPGESSNRSMLQVRKGVAYKNKTNQKKKKNLRNHLSKSHTIYVLIKPKKEKEEVLYLDYTYRIRLFFFFSQGFFPPLGSQKMTETFHNAKGHTNTRSFQLISQFCTVQVGFIILSQCKILLRIQTNERNQKG